MTRPTLLDQPSEPGLAPAGHAEPDRPDAQPTGSGRRWWTRRYWIAAGAAVALLLLAATSLVVSLRALSKPTLSQKAVNGIVNSKVDSAINNLQTQPPAGVAVYNRLAPTMVVIQANRP